MKYLLLFLISGITAMACNQNDAKDTSASAGTEVVPSSDPLTDSANFTTIQWLDSTQQNMGKINEGQIMEVTWRFKNTGSKPLVIINASASCGCTVAEKPEQPIAPGEEGVIKAKFDSHGRAGEQNKQVFVQTNTSGTANHELSFRTEVASK